VNASVVEGGRFAFPRRLRETRGLIVDFDGTIHAGNQWTVTRKLLSEENQQRELEAVRRYFTDPLGRNNFTDAQFIFRSIDRLVEARLRRSQLYEGVKEIVPRDGVEALMRRYAGRSAIVSFGTYDLIRAWVDTHDLNTEIAALRLRWEDDRLKGYLPLTVVSDGNKGYVSETFMSHIGIPPEHCLVLGDSYTDVGMMGSDRLGILVMPQEDKEVLRMAARAEELPLLWPKIGAVLVSNSLMPIMRLFLNT